MQSARRNIENCYIMTAIGDELAHEPEQELLISRTPEKVWRIRPGGGRRVRRERVNEIEDFFGESKSGLNVKVFVVKSEVLPD